MKWFRVRRKERKPRMLCAVWILVLIPLIWIGGDFTYSRVTDRRRRQWEEGIERSATGVRIGCEPYTVGEGKTALMLVHGFADSPAVFKDMAPALAREGFTCRAVRLPGFGEPIDVYAETSEAKWIAMLEQEMEALRVGHSRVWLVGHSLGGALSLKYALDHPDEVEGVIVMAPMIGVSNERSPVLPTRAWFELCDATLNFTTVVENYFPVDSHETGTELYDMRDRFVPAVVYRELFKLMDELSERADELDKPMLMVLSRTDKVTDPGAAQRFFAKAQADRKKITYAADAGHAIPIDRGWKEVVGDIDRFIRTSPEEP